MLRIKNLTAKLDGSPLLQSVNMQVEAGQIHAILGPNGSGKSTLGRALLGDPKYEVQADTLELDEVDMLPLTPAERAQSGYFLSFQSPPELDGITARDFLLAARKAHTTENVSAFRFKKELQQTLSQVRLAAPFADRQMHKGFSGGERKKMEMASLLTLNPKVAFLDEIDSGVDIDAIRSIARGIEAFLSRPKKAVIVVTHSEKLLQEITPTHVHVLCRGYIVETSGPQLIQTVHEKGFDHFLPSGKKPAARGFKVIGSS